MINPQNVVQLLETYILKVPRPIVRSPNPTVGDEDIAKQLYGNLLAILIVRNIISKTKTLDYSFDINQLVEVDENDSDEEDAQGTDCKEEDDDDDGNSLLHQFSVEYMKKVLFYYDEIT